MGARLKLEGMSELKAQLVRLRKPAQRATLARAGQDAMEPMARLARSLAPKDEMELSESIDVGTRAVDGDAGRVAYATAMRASGDRAQAVTAMRDARRAAKGQRGDTYVDVFMGPVAGRTRDEIIKGHVQEFGTQTRAAQPYLRPAFEQDREPLLRRLADALRFEIFDAIGKAAARGRLRP